MSEPVLPEELQAAHDELKAAVAEPHGPLEDRLIDAMLALLAYVERLPRPVPTEPDRESILTDPKAIAARHEVNVTWLLNRIEVTTASGDGVLLGRNEALFVLDLLAALEVE